MGSVVEASIIPGMEAIVVDTSAYKAAHGDLPAGGYVEYQIGDDVHGYSAAFTYDQSLAWAKRDAVDKGVTTIFMRP